MKHRAFTLVTLLSLTLGLASCAKAKESIGLFLYDANDTFVSSLKDNLIIELDDNYYINTYDAKKSQSIQTNQIIDELNKNNPEYLLVNMVDRLSSSSIIQKANQTNTPVIFFNREPVYSDIIKYPNAYYVGTDPKIEGINQGIMAAELMGDPNNINRKIDKNGDGKLQCVFIQGEPNHQDTEMRTYSCINYLQEQGYTLDILTMEAADWNKEKGYTVMSNIYHKYGESIEFVFSNNDDMALGAIDFLLNEIKSFNNKLKRDTNLPFPIVGVDGTKAGLKSIKDGLLYGTTINDSIKQAEAISMLIKLLKKEISINDIKNKFNVSKEKENYVYVSGSLVTLNNIDFIHK